MENQDPIEIFVVEDDKFYGELLVYHLGQNPANKVTRFESAGELLKNLYRKPSIITLDYSLPDVNGDMVLKKIQEYDPEIAVIIISGQEDISTAVSLLRAGAYDYITKDDDTKNRLWKIVNNIRQTLNLKKEIHHLKAEIGSKNEIEKSLIGKSGVIRKIIPLIEKAAGSAINVSIYGETGTGKEVVAKAIHHQSSRAGKRFVAVNMAAIPRELIESELFGHEKGAFTGAHERKTGKFEEADGGTLFLDEIADLDLNHQAKLLRVLQEREFTRIGGNKEIKTDIRLIVATHKDLQEEVKKGNFREDLFYRIMGLTIELPPLRERGNDIMLIAKHYADQYAIDNKTQKFKITEEAQEKLLTHTYPGNVRELRSVIELACVLADQFQIHPEHIRFRSIQPEKDLLLREMTLEEYNSIIIKRYLEKYDQNVLKVAEKLDVGKSTIYRMIKEGKI